jgi:pyridoxamine 5'-phosphate oxidase family protein
VDADLARGVAVFSENELEFLNRSKVGRLATVDREGRPHVIPTGFRLDTEHGRLKIGAHKLPGREQRRAYRRNLEANPAVAFVVDELITEPVRTPRGITIRGRAIIHEEGGEEISPSFGPIWIEIVPEWISSWGIDSAPYDPPNSRKV